MHRNDHRIPVRSGGLSVSGRVHVQHRVIKRKPDESIDPEAEKLTITSGTNSEQASQTILKDWTEDFAQSIMQMLPCADNRCSPRGIAIEREVYYQDGSEDRRGSGKPRRVRVTRRRVVLVGTMSEANASESSGKCTRT